MEESLEHKEEPTIRVDDTIKEVDGQEVNPLVDIVSDGVGLELSRDGERWRELIQKRVSADGSNVIQRHVATLRGIQDRDNGGVVRELGMLGLEYHVNQAIEVLRAGTDGGW